jgi:hypothetical protein
VIGDGTRCAGLGRSGSRGDSYQDFHYYFAAESDRAIG